MKFKAWMKKRMGWQAGKREALVKALTTASLTASHNLKPLLKTPTIESVAIVQFMVLRLPRLWDSWQDVTHWRKTVNCWDMLQVLVSPTALKVVQCDFISVWEMRFIFKKRRISNVHASRFVLTICLGRFEVMFHILGNASISSISIVAISNRMIAQRLLFNLSKQPANALVWGGALVVLLWTQREKSENEICFLPCRPQMRTYLKSHIGEKPNKCS